MSWRDEYDAASRRREQAQSAAARQADRAKLEHDAAAALARLVHEEVISVFLRAVACSIGSRLQKKPHFLSVPFWRVSDQLIVWHNGSWHYFLRIYSNGADSSSVLELTKRGRKCFGGGSFPPNYQDVIRREVVDFLAQHNIPLLN